MRKLSSAEATLQEPTPLQLGLPVRCTDGRVGSLSDVVIDPTERRVSHLVVEAPNGAARLVPADLLVMTYLQVVLQILADAVEPMGDRNAERLQEPRRSDA